MNGELKPALDIVLAVLSAMGAAALGLAVWALKGLIEATKENTLQVKLMAQAIENLKVAQADSNHLHKSQAEKNAKLEKDLNEAHTRIRLLRGETRLSQNRAEKDCHSDGD